MKPSVAWKRIIERVCPCIRRLSTFGTFFFSNQYYCICRISMIVTSLCQSCLKLEWQRAHGHQWSWSGQLLNLSSCRIDHRLSTSHQPQVCSHLPRRKTPHRNSAQVEFLCRLRSEDRVSWLKLWNVNVDRYQSVEQQLVQVNWLLFKTLLANPALVVMSRQSTDTHQYETNSSFMLPIAF